MEEKEKLSRCIHFKTSLPFSSSPKRKRATAANCNLLSSFLFPLTQFKSHLVFKRSSTWCTNEYENRKSYLFSFPHFPRLPFLHIVIYLLDIHLATAHSYTYRRRTQQLLLFFTAFFITCLIFHIFKKGIKLSRRHEKLHVECCTVACTAGERLIYLPYLTIIFTSKTRRITLTSFTRCVFRRCATR